MDDSALMVLFVSVHIVVMAGCLCDCGSSDRPDHLKETGGSEVWEFSLSVGVFRLCWFFFFGKALCCFSLDVNKLI